MTLWRCLLILALAWTTPALALDRDALLDEANVLLLPRERVIPPLTLIDQDGQPFDTRSLQGRWHILFFGFTACPDICPTTLSDMRRVFGQLPSDTRGRLQLVLITADPERDTPQQLKTYLDYYRAGFSGLTGKMEQLQQNETQGDYSVSHSGNLALVGPDGTLRGHIRAPLMLDGLQRALPRIVDTEH